MTEASLSPQLQFEGKTWSDFIDGIRSPATKRAYAISIKRYLNYLKVNLPDDLLLHVNDPKYIERQIIDYIRSLRNDTIGYATIQFLIAPIFTFYQLDDVVLNRKKVSRYLGEFKRIVKDEPYSSEQIEQMLRTADSRMRMIILIMASTGCRIGALPDITLGSLTKIPKYVLADVQKEEWFCSRCSVSYFPNKGERVKRANKFETPGPLTDNHGNIIGDKRPIVAMIDNSAATNIKPKKTILPRSIEGLMRPGVKITSFSSTVDNEGI